jgi:hypothetical protein
MPAPQTDQENCVAHNGSIIPVPGRDIMVQAWYQGGLSVFDFTDSAHPVEIAYFDRGPIDATKLVVGGYWSTYWYNGRIYGSEIARGMDVFRLVPSEYLTANEIEAATSVRMGEFNAQHQPDRVPAERDRRARVSGSARAATASRRRAPPPSRRRSTAPTRTRSAVGVTARGGRGSSTDARPRKRPRRRLGWPRRCARARAVHT